MNWRLSLLVLPLVAVLCTTASGQNLLVNGNFEAGGTSPCDVGKGWTKLANNCLYDGTTHTMSGPYEGLHYGSTDVSGNLVVANVYQTVNVTPGLAVRLRGAYAGWSHNWVPFPPPNGTVIVVPYNHFVRIHDGPDPSAPVLVASQQKPGPGTGNWTSFDITGVPTGSQVCVSWGYDNGDSGWTIVATHVDGLALTQELPSCSGEPTIASVSPAYGANNATATDVTITGENFDSTCQVILRKQDQTDIPATNVRITSSTTIICDLPITGAAMGKWNVVVTKEFCNGVERENAFIVAYPALTNGSFELPGGYNPSCPNPPTPIGTPDGWLQIGISTGTNHLIRDSDQHVPSCPRPDGDHYASIMVPPGTSFGHWRAFQYIAVTPGQEITVSGKFAGGGRSSSRIEILEGDDVLDTEAELLASRLIEDRSGCPPHSYDWLPASVTATPTGGLVTVRWLVRGHTTVPVAAHADALTLTPGPPPAEVCDNGLDDDGDRRTDCQDPDCLATPGCDPPPAEICGNGIDDDGDVRIDCDDSDCDQVCVEVCGDGIDNDQDCEIDDGCENCTNGIDDNGDGLVDCDDPTCLGHPACPSELCTNGVDDNGDGLRDCRDPQCATHEHCAVNDPFADADGDGDVDQSDFAIVQICVTKSNPPEEQYWENLLVILGCGRFDRDYDLDVDQADVTRFEACASGPGILANPACDDPQAP